MDNDTILKKQIKEIVNHHKHRYGYRRVTLALRQEDGVTVNHKKVLKIMREEDLLSKVRKKKYKSYKGEVGNVAPNIIKRDFEATALNQKWVTDITEFKVCDRKIYLSPVMDLFNREIISYTIGLSPNMNLVLSMLDKAIEYKTENDNVVIHSDQGFQYQHCRYVQKLLNNSITQSMSRKGNCLDNSVIQNFFGILKSEMFYNETFESIEDFIHEVKEYIHYYNNERISCRLKGKTPQQVRRLSV